MCSISHRSGFCVDLAFPLFLGPLEPATRKAVMFCHVLSLSRGSERWWFGFREVGVKTRKTKTLGMKKWHFKNTVSTKSSQELSKNSCKGLTKCLAYSKEELLRLRGVICIVITINCKLRSVRPQVQGSTLTIFRELKQIFLTSYYTCGGDQPFCLLHIYPKLRISFRIGVSDNLSLSLLPWPWCALLILVNYLSYIKTR